MKLEFQNRWLRLVIEILPATPAIERYRALPARLDAELGRLLQQQVARRLRRTTSPEAA